MKIEGNQLIQGTPEWLKMRKTHIGSSDIAVIMRMSPWKTPYQLWLEKTNRIQEKEATPWMKHGSLMETPARELYIEQTGNIVIPHVYEYEEWSVALASLDGINEKGNIICEIKCPGMKTFNEALDGIIPEHYEIQIQWQLLITNASKCDYFCYRSTDEYKLIEVLPNKELQEELLRHAKEFWIFVANDIPPPILEKDFVLNEEKEPNELAKEWKKIKAEEFLLREKREEIERKLKEYTDDGNMIFNKAGVKLSRINRKGKVNWKKIQMKFKITQKELDKFRNDSIGFYSFKIINNN